jgi:hypothetical protein
MTERSDSILRHLSAGGGFDIRHSSVLRFAFKLCEVSHEEFLLRQPYGTAILPGSVL